MSAATLEPDDVPDDPGLPPLTEEDLQKFRAGVDELDLQPEFIGGKLLVSRQHNFLLDLTDLVGLFENEMGYAEVIVSGVDFPIPTPFAASALAGAIFDQADMQVAAPRRRGL